MTADRGGRADVLGTAWATHGYVHLHRAHVPLALAELHRSLRPDASATLAFFIGDDFRGRYFSRWDHAQLLDVVAGAGFTVHGVPAPQDEQEHDLHLDVTRARTLPDVVGPRMRMLVCGLNPSLYAADAGIGFARPGNRFWPAALRAGVATRDRDPWHALREHRIGFTDLVKRATVGAAELTPTEYRDGMQRVERLVRWLQPNVIGFVGLAGWRAAVDRKAVAGPQSRDLGGRPVYVMPSSSGLNAHSSVTDLADHLGAALALGDQATGRKGRGRRPERKEPR